MKLEPIGPWIVVEHVAAMMRGNVHMPWTMRAPACFVGLVLAVPDHLDVDLKPGDFVLVEQMSGNPAMASTAPPEFFAGDWRPGRTHPVDLRASAFGGSPDKQAGFVRVGVDALPVCRLDEEATRRLVRATDIAESEKARTTSLVGFNPKLVEEFRRHKAWLKAYDDSRAGKRRSRLKKPAYDEGSGEGVVAKIETAEDLISLGVDPAWLAEHLGLAG